MEMYSDPQWRSRLNHISDDLSKAWDEYQTELNRRVDAYLAEIGAKRKEAPAATNK